MTYIIFCHSVLCIHALLLFLPSSLPRVANATESSHYYTSQRLNAAFTTMGLRKPFLSRERLKLPKA